jgi:MFS family permease
MFFPILPLFLTQVLGAGPEALGIIEGVAESTASLLKVFSGFWSDRLKKRKPLVVLGYSLSSFFRPFIGFASAWPVVLALRFIDRFGKGIRSSPRDALISDITTSENRGASFGLHQAMDHAGAVIGPIATYILIAPYFGIRLSLQNVIFLTAIPAMAAWLTLLFGVEEKTVRRSEPVKKLELKKNWGKFNGDFKFLLIALFVFTLGCSTDAFLLVRLSQVGVTSDGIVLLWSAFHVVKMTAAVVGGRLSDAWGRKPVILLGWAYYAVIYACFASIVEHDALIAVFLAYGIYYGLAEPVEKAFVADLAPSSLRGTAFGYYNLMAGLGAAPASVIFGWVGQRWGYPYAFAMGAAFAGLASVLLFFVKNPRSHPPEPELLASEG